MSARSLNGIIRTPDEGFTTPNIQGWSDKNVIIESEYFRKLTPSIEYILFYNVNNMLWFPAWFEFRSINNNLLYLLYEYDIRSFDVLQKILNSSLAKEEHYTTKIRAMVVTAASVPNHCIALPNFCIEPEFYETLTL